MPKEWVIPQIWPQRDSMAQALEVSPVVAQILCNRGITDIDAARAFLKPTYADILPPETLPGASEAAERIVAAVRAGQRIVLFGDYDVDGITGVSILWHCLRLAEANVDYYIPHRLEEGYGINLAAIDAIADEGANVIVSVDCGVTAIEPALRAKERGIELIITDHHHPHTDASGNMLLPEALLVHPAIKLSAISHQLSARQAESSPSATDIGHAEHEALASVILSEAKNPDCNAQPAPYPNPHLSGAGVALKLAWAIAQKLCNAQRVNDAFRQFLVDATGLAALGIVADVVPLIGENRAIAHCGLLGLPTSNHPGIQALIKSAGLADKKLDGYDIGFKIAPRLNAIGRMGHARLAVEMLTRASPAEAVQIATNLEQQNRARQTLERRIAGEARSMVLEQKQDSNAVRAIVLAREGWHAGVIGIVASRITEEFNRPAVLIALENGAGQGSARSVRNFPLHEGLAACREHLLTYGGHAMAAGLRISADRIDAFRDAFQYRAGQVLTATDLQPRLRLDDEVPLDLLSPRLISDLARLEPHGAGNAAPRLATGWLQVIGEPRTVGTSGDHLQVILGDGRRQCKGIAFGMAKYRKELQDHRQCRVAFRPILNEWQGNRSVELQIIDFQFPTA